MHEAVAIPSDTAGAPPPSETRQFRAGFWAVAFAFLIVMAFGTLPSPLYGLYRTRDHLSAFMVTVIYAIFAVGTIGALLLIQPAGSVALSYVILGERPSLLQLAGVALVLTGVVVAVTGRSPDTDPAPEGGYSRRRTRIIRHASAASTDTSPSKSP